MSQVAARKKLKVDNERVKVTAYFREKGSVFAGTKDGSCERFHLEFFVETNEPQEKIVELVRLGRQMCFTEDALTKAVAVTADCLVNGQILEI